MATIDLTFASESEFLTKFAATPADWVAAGNSYRFLAANGQIVFANPVTLEGKVTGPDNYMEIAYQAGASYMDNSGILTNPLAYDGTKGAAAAIAVGFIPALFSVKMPYVKFTGYQMRQAVGNAGPVIKVFAGAGNVTLDRCILDGFGNSQYDWPLEVNDANFKAISSLIVHNSNLAVAAYVNSKTARFENVTFIRPSNFTKGGFAVRIIGDGGTFDNCAFFGFDALIENPGGETIVRNCGGSGTIPNGTGNLPNLVAADNLVNPASDYRLKTGSVLINAGRTPSSYNTLAPNGVRQQGTAADIGAWETPDALVAPSATVTAVSVTGQNVTISGTTTGVPTTGTASVSPASVPYNSAEAAGPVAITFGSGTFTVTFTALKVGKYNLQYQVANSGYTVTGQNPLGSFDIIGATATVTQDAMSGQVLRLSGSVSGSPTSGQLIVPAAATNPNGAFDQTKAITITGTTYEVSITLPPGNYDAGILRVTNAAGTSLPQSGTSAVSVIGIDGNPEAPEDTSTTTPTVTSVTVSPTTATGSTTFSAVVAGTNSPSQGVSWTATAGTISSAGVFMAPAATSSVQNITITATSLVDPTKSGTAAVTIAATAVATVTSVTVSPNTATDSATFTATVNGTNSPPQTVTWTASAGSISSAGVFTAPAKTSSIQTITITARSTFDTTKTGTATVTLAAASPAASTVTGVTVSPGTATGSTTFSAVVAGTNSPSQAVTWTASAGAISSTGVFTAPAAASSAQSITITARSVQDATKAGTATVTIAAVTVPPETTAPATFARSLSRTINISEVPGVFDQDGRFWLLTNSKKPTGSIDPNATVDITFNWTALLSDIQDTISDVQFDIIGLTNKGAYRDGAFATIFVANAVSTQLAQPSITCRITTASIPPRVEDRTVFLTVEQH